jgi:hypothetical protein
MYNNLQGILDNYFVDIWSKTAMDQISGALINQHLSFNIFTPYKNREESWKKKRIFYIWCPLTGY